MTEKNESERSALLSGRPVTENEEHMTGCGATVCCDPHRALHRYIALCFICLLSFGELKKLQLSPLLIIIIYTCSTI